MTNPLESHVIMTEPITPDQTDGGDSEAAATDAAEEDEEELDPCKSTSPSSHIIEHIPVLVSSCPLRFTAQKQKY